MPRFLRQLACAAVAASACLGIAPALALAHTTAFTFEFVGTGNLPVSGSTYTVTVQHSTVGTDLGLDDFILAYRATGGSITALEYIGTDAYDALPTIPPVEIHGDPSETTHFDTQFVTTPPGVATQLDEIAPVNPHDWYFFPNTTNSLHFITVVPDTSDVRDPVVLEITDQVNSNEIPWAADGAPYPLAIFHRHGGGGTNILPPQARRRLRAQNLLPEGEMDGDDTGDFTNFVATGFDSAIWQLLDVDGSDNSGSAFTQLSTPVDGATASLVSPCIPVSGGNDYHTGGALQTSTGQSRVGTIGVEVVWHDDVSCGNAVSTSTRVDATPGPPFDEITQTVTAPGNAQSAQVQCTAEVSGTSTNTFFATCDSLYLPEPSATATTLAALATLSGLSAFGRSRSQRTAR